MVKQGYKQTEIGVLPESWKLVSLASLSIGGMQNGAFYEVSRKGKGVSFLNVTDLYGFAPIQRETLQKFDATEKEIERFMVKNGDLFFTRSSIVPQGIAFCNWYSGSDDEITIFDSHVIRFKTDLSQVIPMYLYLQCIAPSSRKYFISNAKTATMTTIDQEVLGNCKIALPTIHEQRNIAEAIADIDALIVNLEKLIAKKKAIKQGTMQELLTGKRRLPGFTDKWVIRKIGHWGEFISGSCFPLQHQGKQSEKYPFYKVSDFNNPGNERYMKNANNYISHDTAIVLGCTVLPVGAIVVAKIGAAIFLERKKITTMECCVDNNMMAFVPSNGAAPSFLCYTFLNMRFGDFAEATALPSLSGKTICAIERSFPPTVDEQNAISQVLSDMDNEIELLEKKLKKAKGIKTGMMSELLTGRIRLTDKEDA